MDKNLFERVKKRIEGYGNEIIELQRKLIATKAIGPENGGDGELAKAKVMEPVAKTIYDTVEMFKAPDDRVSYGYRPNIVARKKGKSSDRTIWIGTHMDVVAEGDIKAWKTPPFELTVKDNVLNGRGCQDNHLGIVSAIFSAKALKEEGITPNHDIGIILAAEEETGSKYGVRYLLDNHSNIFGKNDIIIIPDAGNDKGSDVSLAEKSIVWLRIRTQGKQSHAAFPKNGINAHQAAAHLICRMEELNKQYPQTDKIFQPPDNTFIVTMKEKNVAGFNIMPGDDIICFDCRLLPPINVDEFLKTVSAHFRVIEEQFKVKISYEMPFRSDAPAATPTNSPVVSMIREASKDVLDVGINPIGFGGQTVATWFRNKGLHVAVYAKCIEEQFHQPNECVSLDLLKENTKLMAHIMMQ